MWREVESDFLREYGVQMDADLQRMSWRKFAALFTGLSPESATARALAALNDPKSSAHRPRADTQFTNETGFLRWLSAQKSERKRGYDP